MDSGLKTLVVDRVVNFDSHPLKAKRATADCCDLIILYGHIVTFLILIDWQMF